eukprot:gene350-369_t
MPEQTHGGDFTLTSVQPLRTSETAHMAPLPLPTDG